MARIELPSAACRGLDVPGTRHRYEAVDGHIEVEDPRDLAALRRTGLRFVEKRWGVSPAVAGVQCDRCRFNAFAWQRGRPCPRCGGALR